MFWKTLSLDMVLLACVWKYFEISISELQNTTVNINCYRSKSSYSNSWPDFHLITVSRQKLWNLTVNCQNWENNRQPSKLPPHKRPSSETSREAGARKLIGQAKREPSRYSWSSVLPFVTSFQEKPRKKTAHNMAPNHGNNLKLLFERQAAFSFILVLFR